MEAGVTAGAATRTNKQKALGLLVGQTDRGVTMVDKQRCDEGQCR